MDNPTISVPFPSTEFPSNSDMFQELCNVLNKCSSQDTSDTANTGNSMEYYLQIFKASREWAADNGICIQTPKTPDALTPTTYPSAEHEVVQIMNNIRSALNGILQDIAMRSKVSETIDLGIMILYYLCIHIQRNDNTHMINLLKELFKMHLEPVLIVAFNINESYRSSILDSDSSGTEDNDKTSDSDMECSFN